MFEILTCLSHEQNDLLQTVDLSTNSLCNICLSTYILSYRNTNIVRLRFYLAPFRFYSLTLYKLFSLFPVQARIEKGRNKDRQRVGHRMEQQHADIHDKNLYNEKR